MAEFESHGVNAGVWSGHWTGSEDPGQVVLAHAGKIVAQGETRKLEDGKWQLRAKLPIEHIHEGMSSFIMLADDANPGDDLRPGATRIAALHLVAGEALDGDLRAELDLLRAELDLLKREFRHMAIHGRGR